MSKPDTVTASAAISFSLFPSLHVTSSQKLFIFFIRAFYHRIESAHRAREKVKMRRGGNEEFIQVRATLSSFSPSLHPRLSSFTLTISATRVSLRCITMNGSGNCAFNILKLLPSKHEKSLRFSPMSQGNLSPSFLFIFLAPSLFLPLFYSLFLSSPLIFYSFTLLTADSPLVKVLKWQLVSPFFSCTFSPFISYVLHPNFVLSFCDTWWQILFLKENS